MTTEVTTLPTLPQSPHSVLRPTTFNADSDATFAGLVSVVTAYNANVPALNAVAAAAANVETLVDEAQAASDTAASAANYKGAWSALTGALAIPASVSHAGKLWLLVSNVADVTAHQPGVSGQWIKIGGGGMDLLGIYTLSGAAALDIEVLSSAYNNYLCVLENITTSSSMQLHALFKLNGSYVTTGTYYGTRWQYDGSSTGGGTTSADTRSPALCFNGTAGVSKINGELMIHAANTAGAAMLRSQVTHLSSTTAGNIFNAVTTNSGAYVLQGVRIYPTSGTFAGGTIRVFGLTNS